MPEVAERVIESVERTGPRSPPPIQEEIVRGLCRIVVAPWRTGHRAFEGSMEKILDVASRLPGGLPSLARDLGTATSPGEYAWLRAAILTRAWPASRDVLEELLSGAGAAGNAEWFFMAATGQSWRSIPEVAAHFARSHPDPRVRAISLLYVSMGSR